jgi:hypothetical protein
VLSIDSDKTDEAEQLRRRTPEHATRRCAPRGSSAPTTSWRSTGRAYAVTTGPARSTPHRARHRGADAKADQALVDTVEAE